MRLWFFWDSPLSHHITSHHTSSDLFASRCVALRRFTHTQGKGHRLDNNLERSHELETQLKELEASVVSVLNLALGFGPVHIVTNAETGWVQMSAQV